ncbi:MAG: ABC transporter substrate-binding protein [Rubrivivax sp.]
MKRRQPLRDAPDSARPSEPAWPPVAPTQAEAEIASPDPRRRSLLHAAAAGATLGAFGIPAAGQAQPVPVRGGQLVVAMPGRPRHLNPALLSGSPMMPAAQLFASPMVMGPDWKPRPYLAERWSVSEDGRSITLHLRRDAVFHDGRPVTAEDVEFSVQAVRDHHPFKGMFAPVHAVTLPDRHTAVVRLAEPHPALQLAMTTVFVPILPRHVYGDGQPLAAHPRNSAQVVGSGPFRLVEFKPGEHLILQRFDAFFLKDRPLLDRLVFREFKDPASIVLAFERGEIDYVPFVNDPKEIARLRRVPGARVHDDHLPGVGSLVWLAFNTRHPKLADQRVRQAISHAIDRDFIVKHLATGAVRVSTGPIHSSSPFYTADVPRQSFDPRRSMALLDAAGLRPGGDGKRLSLSCDTPNATDQRLLAEYLRPALAKVGIDVTLRVAPDFPTWARRVGDHDFEMTADSVWNWGDPVIGVHRTYQSSNIRKGVIWSNTQQYANPRVDELLAQAGRERDVAARKKLYAEMQRIVVDDCPIAYVFETGFAGALARTVAPHAFGVWGPLAPLDGLGMARV